MAGFWSRRDFLGGMIAAGGAGLLGFRPGVPASLLGTQSALAAERPPETTKIRLVRDQLGGICTAPAYYAEVFLRREGFTDVQYIEMTPPSIVRSLGAGEIDLVQHVSLPLIIGVDQGEPIVMLAGIHSGCYELFGNSAIRTIRDLKGKSVAIPGFGSGRHAFLATMAAYVGMDHRKDINWVTYPPAEGMRLFAEAKIDAFIGFPPEPQELRNKKIGHVVVNTMMDRPWSQYFCCMAAGNREFTQKHPVATRRALRAMLKAADICALEPARVAKFLVARGYTQRYDLTVQTLREMTMAYTKWREYLPEDTMRFYALRLQEVGMIKSSPQRIIAQGTDWRFLNELKKEMKG